MRNIKLSIVALCVIFIANGCSGGKGHPGVGYLPIINDVILYNVDLSSASNTKFKVGAQVTISMDAQDEGTMKTLLITEFPADPDTPVPDQLQITLPAQSSYSQSYTGLGPIALSGPAGDYRMDIQVKDAGGGISEVLSIDYTLE
jgi:hypothetical protein